jgi:transposase-like protein
VPEQRCPTCNSDHTVPIGGIPAERGKPPVHWQYGCQRCGSVFFVRGWDMLGRPTGYAIYPAGQEWRQIRYTGIKHGLTETPGRIVWGRGHYG